jgi:putative peptidoglycan lipid II flippase
VLVASLVLAGLLVWGDQHFDWVGLRSARLQRIGLLAALIAGAGVLYFAVLAITGLKLRSFVRR